jgi:vacuolar iron transporter family protein
LARILSAIWCPALAGYARLFSEPMTARGAPNQILIAGAPGLVAGAMSLAAGEYVSVSSQSDTEHADLVREQAELDNDPDAEHAVMSSAA